MGVNIIEGKSCKNAGSALVGSRFFTAFFFQYNYLEERKEHNMSQQVYPQINRVVQTESGALRGVPAGITNTRFLKVSLMRLLQWEICGGKSLNPLSLGKVCGMLRALDRLLLSIEILWVLCTGTSFIAAPNPWMRTVSISTYGRRPLPMMKKCLCYYGSMEEP